MSAPMPKQLFICDHACTCDGPYNCDHRKPHTHFRPEYNSPFGLLTFNECCDNRVGRCLFVQVPVGCIPFTPIENAL